MIRQPPLDPLAAYLFLGEDVEDVEDDPATSKPALDKRPLLPDFAFLSNCSRLL